MRLTSNNYYRHGLTLIEVVAGLALMGTLLAAMLTAKGRFTQQHHYAQRVLVAVDAADTLLAARWDLAGLGGGIDAWGSDSGAVAGNDALTWRTVEITDDHAAGLRSRIIRLEIFDNQSNPGDPPLVSVDMLLPLPTEETEQVLDTDAVLDTGEPTPLTEAAS